MKKHYSLFIVLIGLISGLVTGLLGIGGGTVLVPAMTSILNEKEHVAHGTSLAVILPTALISTVIYSFNRYVNIGLAIQIAISGMIGGYMGAKLMNRLPSAILRKLFAVFLIIAGLKMVI